MNASAATPAKESNELAALKAELALANLEINAIKVREETYFKQGDLESMIPWFDLADEEREKAIEYFGPETIRGELIFPVADCNSVADIRAYIASLRA